MRNTNRRWMVLPICTLLLLALTSHPAFAASRSNAGNISGQLVNGTHKNAPVPGEVVTLQMAQDQNSKDLATQKTDAQGHFSFTNLATDKTISYAVYIKFQGAQYTSDVLTLDSKPRQQIQLLVYDATTDSSKLAIVESTVLIDQPDPRGNTLSVSEIVAFRNLDTRTYVGSLDASKGKPNALLFSLPANVRQVTVDKGFEGYQQIQVDRGFAANAAVPPGASEFGFSFQVAPGSASYDFLYKAIYPTVDLSILVAPNIHASSGSLSAKGLISANQSTYQLFKTSTLRAGDEVHVNMENLPGAPTTNTQTPVSNTSLLLLGLALLLMVLVVFTTWLGLRKRQAQARRLKGGKRETLPAFSSASKEQQELLREMADLDKEFEEGKISKAAYQDQRAKTKARLRSLLREEETSRR